MQFILNQPRIGIVYRAPIPHIDPPTRHKRIVDIANCTRRFRMTRLA
jgi:hypothetical protein